MQTNSVHSVFSIKNLEWKSVNNICNFEYWLNMKTINSILNGYRKGSHWSCFIDDDEFRFGYKYLILKILCYKL